MKKIIMMLLFLIGVIGFSEEEFSYKGYDLPFTNDGKLYENMNKKTEKWKVSILGLCVRYWFRK